MWPRQGLLADQPREEAGRTLPGPSGASAALPHLGLRHLASRMWENKRQLFPIPQSVVICPNHSAHQKALENPAKAVGSLHPLPAPEALLVQKGVGGGTSRSC